tara:strand:+ start:223 stop:1329 length:1107 start_codon:yes stop_codon:yes gene_type:complete
MKTILVTGGTGFLGSTLCHYLVKQGHYVICLDNNYVGSLEAIEDLLNKENFEFILHDVVTPISFERKIDQIYHMACPGSPIFYQEDYAIHTTKTSVIGSINILNLAVEHDATVLFTSTSECYGDPLEHPQKESYRGNVNTIGIRACYDEGKRCAESLFFDYHRQKGVDIRVVRIFNTYGPNMNPLDGRVVTNFICQAIEGNDITIYGDGSQTRSFCYADDLIDGLERMMNNRIGFTGPVNLGNPGEFTIRELAEIVLNKVDSESKLIEEPLPEDDPTQRKPDISLAKSVLGWEPKISLEEGLNHTIKYYEEVLKTNKFKDITINAQFKLNEFAEQEAKVHVLNKENYTDESFNLNIGSVKAKLEGRVC